MAKRQGITQTAAAERVGCSQSRIYQLAKAGRIEKLADGSLDPVSVEAIAAELASKREADADVTLAAAGGDWATITTAEAIRRKEAALAWTRTMEAKQKAGELIEVEAAAQEYEKVAAAVREKFLALPSRAASQLGLDVKAKGVLDGLVREALLDLSTG